MLTFTWVLPWNEAFRAGEGEKFPGAFSAHQGHDVVLGHARGVGWRLPLRAPGRFHTERSPFAAPCGSTPGQKPRGDRDGIGTTVFLLKKYEKFDYFVSPLPPLTDFFSSPILPANTRRPAGRNPKGGDKVNRVAADMLVNLGLMLLVALIIRCGSPPGALGGV